MARCGGRARTDGQLDHLWRHEEWQNDLRDDAIQVSDRLRPRGLQQRRGGQFADDPDGCRPRRPARGGRPLDTARPRKQGRALRTAAAATQCGHRLYRFRAIHGSEVFGIQRPQASLPHEAVRLHQSRGRPSPLDAHGPAHPTRCQRGLPHRRVQSLPHEPLWRRSPGGDLG